MGMTRKEEVLAKGEEGRETKLFQFIPQGCRRGNRPPSF